MILYRSCLQSTLMEKKWWLFLMFHTLDFHCSSIRQIPTFNAFCHWINSFGSSFRLIKFLSNETIRTKWFPQIDKKNSFHFCRPFVHSLHSKWATSLLFVLFFIFSSFNSLFNSFFCLQIRLVHRLRPKPFNVILLPAHCRSKQ